MTIAIPAALLEAVAEGRAVLFLGAGASRGAGDGKGHFIPDGRELARLIVKAFLNDDYADYDFRSAYDLAASVRDVRTVQRFLFDTLNPFHPADFHLLVPRLPWAGILTTNYDLVVERAFDKVVDPLQQLVPHTKDDDGALEHLGVKSLVYVKLHGSITRHHETHPPMVASTEQLIAFREGRQGQFDIFLEWAKTKTLIFCGYAFLDSNLRLLFNEIIREGDKRPRHYIVSPSLKSAEEDYWRERRVVTISGSFEEFVQALDHTLPSDKRAVGVIARSMLHETSFTKFITTPSAKESAGLKAYLGALADHVTPEIAPAPADLTKFYQGFDLGWLSIKENLDVHRSITNEILLEQVIPSPVAERAKIVVLKGHAGAGKSTVLRRIAWEAAARHGKLCFFINREGMIDVSLFEEIFSLTNLPIYLFVDNVAEHKRKLLELINSVRQARAAVKIICAESFVLWNAYCDELEPHVQNDYEMRYLSEAEIEELLSKLTEHNSLGYLRKLPPDKRKEELRFVHGRQLLVALLEATHGAPFVEILTEEYRSIPLAEARRLYLDICCLHRFGPPVRAGLISRIHDISFDDFKERLFRPLEQVVQLRRDVKSGDYVYESRHSHIAHELYHALLTSQDERFDNLVRIITKLNPSFSYDLEVIGRLVKAETIRSIVSDRGKGLQIYDAAIQAAGRRPVILHQLGIYQMGIATNRAELDRAEASLEEALALETFNRSIKHSLAELALRRSRLAIDALERQSWRQVAIERASALTTGDSSPYPHHTMLKASVDEVRDCLANAEEKETEANVLALGDAINRAEEFLQRGLQKFPNDPALLGEEGELSNILSQAKRAEQAFEKAFASNPRSTLLARRLSRIQRAKQATDPALATLRKALEANPSSRELHNDIAMVLIESDPMADQKFGDEILYHLRRAFSPGDKNYSAQFFFARQLSLSSRFEEALPIFSSLGEAHIPYSEKARARESLKDDAGAPRRLTGTITAARQSYGFAESDSPKMRVFVQMNELRDIKADDFLVGFPVSFELAFNIRGPLARNLRSMI